MNFYIFYSLGMQRLDENGEWVLYPTNYEFEGCKSVSEYVEKEIVEIIRSKLSVSFACSLFNLSISSCNAISMNVSVTNDENDILTVKKIIIDCNYEEFIKHVSFNEERLAFEMTEKPAIHPHKNITSLVKFYLNNVSLAHYLVWHNTFYLKISFVNIAYWFYFPLRTREQTNLQMMARERKIKIAINSTMQQILKEMGWLVAGCGRLSDTQKLTQRGLIEAFVAELMFIGEMHTKACLFANVRKTGARPAVKTADL